MEVQEINSSKVELNKGQIPGLPANPRQFTQADIDGIAKSMEETPELFAIRPCIVAEWEGKYILLGGNLRFMGARKLKMKKVPCVVVPSVMSVEKMKQIVIKDNGSFGAWDYDSLANEWDDLPLCDYGVPVWDTKEPEPKRDKTADKECYNIIIECTSAEEQQLAFLDLSLKYKCHTQ